MAVRRVDDDDVDAGRGQRLDALVGVAAGADRGADAQPAEVRPCDASGCSVDLRMSLTVMRPRSSMSPLTTSTRSSRCWCISSFARSRSVPSGTVTRRSPLVMMLATGWSRFVSNRVSRLVTMPTTRLPSTTGRPEKRCCRLSASTSRTDIVGGIVIGSLTTPLSKRLTFATSAACFAGDMFLCTMPRPPSCAIAIARRASVTVSIAADSSGMLSVMLRVRRVCEADVAGNDEGMRGDEQDVVERQRFPDDTHNHFSCTQKWIIPAPNIATNRERPQGRTRASRRVVAWPPRV